MVEHRIRIPGETISGLAQRYRVLSNEQFVNKIMRETVQQADSDLYIRMVDLTSHPKDTGLLQQSWKIPKEYINSHKGKIWEVYLDNTATVGRQYYLKHGKLLYTSGRQRHKRGNPKILKNIKYMRFVDKRTKFYTKQLRVMRQKVDSIFNMTLIDNLRLVRSMYPQLFTPEQTKAIIRGEI